MSLYMRTQKQMKCMHK
uniref:Uncharacterized protein n=1 Tax=Arundo donax TaxID=35708 RepID=A0A0A9EBT9_ARUDO